MHAFAFMLIDHLFSTSNFLFCKSHSKFYEILGNQTPQISTVLQNAHQYMCLLIRAQTSCNHTAIDAFPKKHY